MTTSDDSDHMQFWRIDLIYSLLLFVVACVAVYFCVSEQGILASNYGWRTAAFFVAFGLFTISTGFPHPGFGHVSFDRAAQVTSILVLGPVDAAWINGLASFLYPWHRLLKGIPFRTVLVAALNNAGLMSLVVLLCGSLYQMLGGPIELQSLDLKIAGLILVLMLTVISVGMLVIRQYAVMRQRLEMFVDERTEDLRVQTLEFERQATHDKLTGLPNRRYADDFLERSLELAHRSGETITVALADIDHFKRINDRFSHAVGDDVLRRVAHLLRERCRKSDVVARYGGEEFVLCFPDTDAEFAEQICDQIRLAIQNTDWSRIEGAVDEPLCVTISFGLAESEGRNRVIAP